MNPCHCMEEKPKRRFVGRPVRSDRTPILTSMDDPVPVGGGGVRLPRALFGVHLEVSWSCVVGIVVVVVVGMGVIGVKCWCEMLV